LKGIDKRDLNKGVKPKSSNKILTNFYGVLAVIFVLIPEWIAELTLSISEKEYKDDIINVKNFWAKNPFLFVSSLTIKELRLLAYKLKIHGYASENQHGLQKRVIKKLNKRYPKI
tara:strand:+ start:7940 stop:8284 length:345 start_codon:yes stop_codon:yes gene_type:complete